MTLFQIWCTFQANVNLKLGKISLQAVCHPGEENLTGVSERYNWNFDAIPTYWVVRYSVKHSHNGAFSNVRRMPMNPKDMDEKYEKIDSANTWSKTRNPQQQQRQMMFKAVLVHAFVTFQWIDSLQGKSWLSSTSPPSLTSPPSSPPMSPTFFKVI